MKLTGSALTFLLALLLVGFSVGFGLKPWAGFAAVGSLLAVDYYVSALRSKP